MKPEQIVICILAGCAVALVVTVAVLLTLVLRDNGSEVAVPPPVLEQQRWPVFAEQTFLDSCTQGGMAASRCQCALTLLEGRYTTDDILLLSSDEIQAAGYAAGKEC